MWAFVCVSVRTFVFMRMYVSAFAYMGVCEYVWNIVTMYVFFSFGKTLC